MGRRATRRTGPDSVTERRNSGRGPEKCDNLALLGMPPQPGLFINWSAVLEHLEPAAGTGHQCDLRGRKLTRKLGRQTGGPWLVVSNRAVFDGNLHWARRSGDREI